MRLRVWVPLVLALVAGASLSVSCGGKANGGSGTSGPAPTVPPGIAYLNEAYSFSTQYPAGWVQLTPEQSEAVGLGKQDVVVAFVPESESGSTAARAGMLVRVHTLSDQVVPQAAEMFLFNLDAQVTSMFQQEMRGTIVEKDHLSLGDLAARRYVVDFEVSTPKRGEWIYAVRGNQEFELSCLAGRDEFDEVSKACDAIIKAFVTQ